MSSLAVVPATAAARPMIYLGMDVHKDAITIAVLPALAKTPTRLAKLANDLPKRPQIAVVAVARELVGFLWAVAREVAPGTVK